MHQNLHKKPWQSAFNYYLLASAYEAWTYFHWQNGDEKPHVTGIANPVPLQIGDEKPRESQVLNEEKNSNPITETVMGVLSVPIKVKATTPCPKTRHDSTQ